MPTLPYRIYRKHIDVFKADIWLLGRMLHAFFGTQTVRSLHLFSGHLNPITQRIPTIASQIRDMYSLEPGLRPTAQECLDQFCEAVPKVCWSLIIPLPDAHLIAHHGNDVTKKWPMRRGRFTREYLKHMFQFLTSRGKPRVFLLAPPKRMWSIIIDILYRVDVA